MFDTFKRLIHVAKTTVTINIDSECHLPRLSCLAVKFFYALINLFTFVPKVNSSSGLVNTDNSVDGILV
ncbi:MAG: hypothetical protein KAH20_01395 [Methylococcales bacterium]|nr:hypothetical protein [Methylococcales bacterium]